MKVCRKCRKKVANKSKICKYCGADVSKAKIIKTSKPDTSRNKSNNKSKKQNDKQNNKPIKQEEKNIIREVEETKIAKLINEKPDNKEQINKIIEIEKNIEKDNKLKEVLNKIKNKFKTIKNKIKDRKENKDKNNKRINLKVKINTIKNKIRAKREKNNKEFSIKTKIIFLKNKLKERKDNNNNKNDLNKRSKIKTKFITIKNKLKEKRLDRKNKPKEEKLLFKFKQKLLKLKERKKVKKEEKNGKNKQREIIPKNLQKREERRLKEKANIVRNRALEKERETLDLTRELIRINKEKIKNSKPIKNKKIKLFIKLLIIFILMGAIASISLYFLSSSAPKEVVQIRGEKATNDKLFAIGDIINYNGVSYKVANIELSGGNSYSSPKEGNVYVIVTLYIINNTEHQIDYSYNSWILSDKKSKNDRIVFSSINVEDALYSGRLNAGGTKRGSIIYEVSKKAEDLRLSFYEVEINQDKEESIDYNKKLFSVNIELPKVEKKNKKEK